MDDYDNPLIALVDDPLTDRVHQPYSAFNQGYDAFDLNYPDSLNPYPEESREWRYWDNGWKTAWFYDKGGAYEELDF
jgi:hypothetical protein